MSAAEWEKYKPPNYDVDIDSLAKQIEKSIDKDIMDKLIKAANGS